MNIIFQKYYQILNICNTNTSINSQEIRGKIFNQCIVFPFKPLIIAHFPVTLETSNISGGR